MACTEPVTQCPPHACRPIWGSRAIGAKTLDFISLKKQCLISDNIPILYKINRFV
jgi:hypothetical protein